VPRLPNPGSDDDVWGDVLNDFLLQSHKSDGTLKDASVGTTQVQDDAVTAGKIAATNNPSNGNYLGYSGGNLTWGTPGGGSGPQIFVQSTDPGGSAQDGDIWIDTSA
jgi:hypothetical protein